MSTWNQHHLAQNMYVNDIHRQTLFLMSISLYLSLFRSIFQCAVLWLHNYYPCCAEKLKLSLIKHSLHFLSLLAWPGGGERDEGVEGERNDAVRSKKRESGLKCEIGGHQYLHDHPCDTYAARGEAHTADIQMTHKLQLQPTVPVWYIQHMCLGPEKGGNPLYIWFLLY